MSFPLGGLLGKDMISIGAPAFQGRSSFFEAF